MDALALSSSALIGQAQNAYSDLRVKQASQAAGAAGDLSKIRETAEGFEGLFIGQMLQHMWTDLDVNPEFGGGHGEQVWRSMLIDEYGKQIAKSGRLGIADNVMQVMLRAQEQRDAGAAKLAEATTGNEATAGAVAVAARVRP